MFSLDKRKIIRMVLMLVLPLGNAQAYRVDPTVFLLLPPHCQSFFAGMAEKGHVEGLNIDISRYKIDIYKRLGSGAVFTNHYCPPLQELIRFQREGQGLLSDAAYDKRLDHIMNGMNYQMRSKWTDENIWFKSEIHTNKARVYQLKGNEQQAIKELDLAIKVYPPYLPAYWLKAEILESLQRPEDAIDTLTVGKEYARNDKAKQNFDSFIGNLKANSTVGNVESTD